MNLHLLLLTLSSDPFPALKTTPIIAPERSIPSMSLSIETEPDSSQGRCQHVHSTPSRSENSSEHFPLLKGPPIPSARPVSPMSMSYETEDDSSQGLSIFAHRHSTSELRTFLDPFPSPERPPIPVKAPPSTQEDRKRA
jgi:hypothetical protein